MIISQETRVGLIEERFSRHHFTVALRIIWFSSFAKWHPRCWHFQADKITNDCHTKRPNCNFLYCFTVLFFIQQQIDQHHLVAPKSNRREVIFNINASASLQSRRDFFCSLFATRRLSLHFNRKMIFSRLSFVWWTWSERSTFVFIKTTWKNFAS